jgi:hypothetical protein
MMRFRENTGRDYMMVVEFTNACWSYLFSREWCSSIGNTLRAFVLLAVLIPVTPIMYLCVAPFVTFLGGAKEEEDLCL